MPVEIMPAIDGWPCNAITANFKENEQRWTIVDEDFYYEMLCALPPVYRGLGGYLMGEPYDRRGKVPKEILGGVEEGGS